MRLFNNENTKEVLGLTNAGFEIVAAALKGEYSIVTNYLIVKGKSCNDKYVTWQCHYDDGEYSFYWGHYFDDEFAADKDLIIRILDR